MFWNRGKASAFNPWPGKRMPGRFWQLIPTTESADTTLMIWPTVTCKFFLNAYLIINGLWNCLLWLQITRGSSDYVVHSEQYGQISFAQRCHAGSALVGSSGSNLGAEVPRIDSGILHDPLVFRWIGAGIHRQRQWRCERFWFMQYLCRFITFFVCFRVQTTRYSCGTSAARCR